MASKAPSVRSSAVFERVTLRTVNAAKWVSGEGVMFDSCYVDSGIINNLECSILGEFTGHGHALKIQETP